MTNLLKYKIKKIVAENGYLKKSDLTEYELAQLDNKPHTGKLVDIWDEFLKGEADDRDQTS